MTGHRIIPPFSAAVKAHHRCAELKTAQDSTKSDLDSGVIIALRKKAMLGTTGQNKNIYKQVPLIPFSGKRGEKQELFNWVR